MDESAHTEGPWDFDTDDLGTWINSPSHPQPIAKMGSCTHLPKLANARLIAAAPDLLAALDHLLHETMFKDHPEASQRAIDAITKATGLTP